jgi:polysaccharide pyruvyl transferase WcaK-like protein
MPKYLRHVGPLLDSVASRAFSKPAPKQTGYIGWVGHHNLGDEAVYDAIRALVRPLSLTDFSAARETILGRMSLSGRRHFQGVLLGGGTIIGPAYSVPVRRTLGLRLPMATFGTGVGSTGFGDTEHPELQEWRGILDRFEMVSVRGPRSYAALTNLGIQDVRIIGDPALSLGPSVIPPLRERPTLVINLAGAPDDKYGAGQCACYREIAVIAKQHVAQGGDLLPVALGHGDSRFLRDLLADAGLETWSVRRLASVDEFVDCVSGAQLLIGVRLHSAVLASTVGTVPILLAYRNKCWDFMESLDLARLTVTLDASTGQAIRKALEFANSHPALRYTMFEKVQQWRAEQNNYANRVVARFSAAQC